MVICIVCVVVGEAVKFVLFGMCINTNENKVTKCVCVVSMYVFFVFLPAVFLPISRAC